MKGFPASGVVVGAGAEELEPPPPVVVGVGVFTGVDEVVGAGLAEPGLGNAYI